MRGQSHVITGISTAAVVTSAEFAILHLDMLESVKTAADTVKTFLITDPHLPVWITVMTGILLYILGVLLPDIDTPYSAIGRRIHIPFKHRTWTHAVWFPLLFGIAGIFFKPLFWLSMGMLIHDFWDSLSASGIHWFYPFRKDKTEHIFKLYHTGKTSERVVAAVSVVLAVVSVLLTIWFVYRPFEIVFR